MKTNKYKPKPIYSKGDWLIEKFDRIEKNIDKLSCKRASKLSLKQKKQCIKMSKICREKLIQIINEINKPINVSCKIINEE